MKRSGIRIFSVEIIIIIIILLCGCSKEKEMQLASLPDRSLSEITSEPTRQAVFNATRDSFYGSVTIHSTAPTDLAASTPEFAAKKPEFSYAISTEAAPFSPETAIKVVALDATLTPESLFFSAIQTETIESYQTTIVLLDQKPTEQTIKENVQAEVWYFFSDENAQEIQPTKITPAAIGNIPSIKETVVFSNVSFPGPAYGFSGAIDDPSTCPATYTLRKGETPFCIAQRYGLNYKNLMTENRLALNAKSPENITLNLNLSSGWDQVDGERRNRPRPALYQVQWQDTIPSIACLFGDVTPEQIAEKNGMRVEDPIELGMQLEIP